jgi:hypothetical protein
MTDSFHIILPSNSSMGSFPNNSVANYVTQLFNPITLEGSWEMALMEIHFPNTCFNTYKAMTITEPAEDEKTVVQLEMKPTQAQSNENPSHIYVYCDLVEPQIVGDTMAPIIRMVNTDYSKAKFGENITKSFVSLQYVPLMKLNFSTVEMDLRDSAGQLIPFCSGHSSVTLHFRRSLPRGRFSDQ